MIKIKIDKLNHQGVGIGKIDNKVIFIPKTVPNDIVEIEIIKDNKNYYEGRVINYLSLSEDRINFDCPYFNKCGGCHLGCLNYQKQLEYKVSKVEEILNKYANVNLNLNIVPSDRKYFYRNKITLHVKNNKLGYYFEKTHELIEIDNCILISQKMNEIISLLKRLDLSLVTEVIIRENNNELMVIIKGKIKEKELINTLINKVISIYINEKCIYGKEYLIEKLDNYKFQISPDAFFQVNTTSTIKLYDLVRDALKDSNNKTVLDLFCGTGTISIYISKYCKEVLGLEINKSAILNAQDNKKMNNIKNVHFINQDVSKITKIDKDIVIVDPPRSGLTNNITKLLITSEVEKIIYVSCNPLTLARDIKILKEKYDISNITLVDMFPNTYHVECVCVLHKKKC